MKNIRIIVVGRDAPQSTNVLWLDTTDNSNILKIFRTGWESVNTTNDKHSLYVDKEYIYSNGSNIFSKEDFKYIVTDPITINNTVTFGKNSVLEFTKNGRINGNGTLVFNNSEIIADKHQIFDTSIVFNGLLINDAFYPEWFGAVGDGKTDDWLPIQTSIENVGHVPVVLTAEKYLVKKTISVIEPLANAGVNKYYEYANSSGDTWNNRQTLHIKHDIIGDASLEDAVIRIGSNQSYLIIDGALVVRNPSDKALGISCAGHTYTKGDSTTGYDHIFTGDLGSSPHIKVNTIIKGNDGFTYYTSNAFNDATATTKYGLGKGTAILYGGGAGNGVEVQLIHGFRVGIWIALSNGGKFTVGRSGCINDILIDSASYLWAGGVTRNDIRICVHQMNKAWYWVAHADEPISIFRIKGNASVTSPTIEVSNNRFILDHDNSIYSYNHIFFKDGNNPMTGNKLEAAYTLTGNYSGNSFGWEPIKILAPTKASRTNNGNKFYNDVTWDYTTLNITDGYNCEVGPVVIDSNTHTNCYRYGNAASDITTRFLCEKIYFTHETAPEMNTTKNCIRIIVPHYSQLSRIHIYDSTEGVPESSAMLKGHIYIDKNASSLTGCPKHLVKGYESGTVKDLGYYIDTMGLIK